jgi:hypothetical protein
VSGPRIRHWADRAGRNRVTLFRSERNPLHRAVTVRFTPEEWTLVRRTVLAEYGLISEAQSRENVDRAYLEVERAQKQIADLERELTYASGQQDDDDTEGGDDE